MKRLTIILLLTVINATTTFAKKQKKIDRAFVDSVFVYICKSNILYPNIVIRQIILETGWLRDKKMMSINNIFGFRNRKRFLTFDTWQQSVLCYKKWQDKHYTNKSENYYTFLRRKKYARRNYKTHLLKIRYNKTCTDIILTQSADSLIISTDSLKLN